jgi:proline dehydrogenase
MSDAGIGTMPRLWQRAMIWLACNKNLARFMQANPLTCNLARRYVGGADRAEALACVGRLREKGVCASLYYLGEYVDTFALVEQNVEEILASLATFNGVTPSIFFSVDPTQIGYSVSQALGRGNAARIAAESAKHPGIAFIMLDMEDPLCVEPTIALYQELRATGAAVAVTLQACLRRTEQDFERLAKLEARIRLVKGAFVAGKDIAWTRKRDIDAAYDSLAQRALSQEMKSSGLYPIFATHDDRILDRLKPILKANGWQPHQYEIEMLLGVREPLQASLACEGHTVRVYVPFGTEWWAYTARRIGENPANARFVLQALLGM